MTNKLHEDTKYTNSRAYWQRHAERYDMSIGLLTKPIPRMLELVGEAVAGRERILEVAAGTGLLTPVISKAGTQIVATDYAGAMVERLREKTRDLQNVECQQADIYGLPFESESFDAVVAANVLHLLPDLNQALSALAAVLRPGGILVVPTFCHNQNAASWLFSRALAVTGFPGCRRFSFKSLRDTLEGAGISIGRQELIPGLLPIGFFEGGLKV